MKSNIMLTVYTLIICQSTAQRAFCPVRSPSNQVIYFTDKPSWSATSLLKTQCTMECSFCSSKQTCGDCRAFNYNSTSQNCSIFNFEPKSYDIDPNGSAVGYRVSKIKIQLMQWREMDCQSNAMWTNLVEITTNCKKEPLGLQNAVTKTHASQLKALICLCIFVCVTWFRGLFCIPANSSILL